MANELKLAAQLNGRCEHFGDFTDIELQEAGVKPEELVAKYLGFEPVDENTIRLKYFCNYCQQEETVEQRIEDDFLYIGDCPSCEEPFKTHDSRTVCKALILQLRNTFGNEPDGARLSAKLEMGGGGYYTVVCHYNTGKPLSVAYAFMLEGNLPATWSPAAQQFLSLHR